MSLDNSLIKTSGADPETLFLCKYELGFIFVYHYLSKMVENHYQLFEKRLLNADTNLLLLVTLTAY
jgi:hypothetical protein